jgi:fatty acid desaturase
MLGGLTLLTIFWSPVNVLLSLPLFVVVVVCFGPFHSKYLVAMSLEEIKKQNKTKKQKHRTSNFSPKPFLPVALL